jgi:hypothetical protein
MFMKTALCMPLVISNALSVQRLLLAGCSRDSRAGNADIGEHCERRNAVREEMGQEPL